MRTLKEIDDQIDEAYKQIDGGSSRWSGMSYEQGVVAALEWIQEFVDDLPMQDDDHS